MEKKKITGRKTLDKKEKRNPFKIYLNDFELERIIKRKGGDDSSLSEYLRAKILDDSQNASHINPVSFLNDMTDLSFQVNKVGVNINQLAKHVNELKLQNVIPVNVSDAIEDKLEEYLMHQKVIIEKLKEIIIK